MACFGEAGCWGKPSGPTPEYARIKQMLNRWLENSNGIYLTYITNTILPCHTMTRETKQLITCMDEWLRAPPLNQIKRARVRPLSQSTNIDPGFQLTCCIDALTFCCCCCCCEVGATDYRGAQQRVQHGSDRSQTELHQDLAGTSRTRHHVLRSSLQTTQEGGLHTNLLTYFYRISHACTGLTNRNQDIHICPVEATYSYNNHIKPNWVIGILL